MGKPSKIYRVMCRSFFVVSLLALIPIESYSQPIESEGRYYFPANISQVEACQNAFLDARQAAMSKAGLERGNFSQMDICSETEKGASCSLIQINQSYFDGGYILSEEKVSEQIRTENDFRECVVTGKFEVKKFSSQPDLNFLVEAELNQQKFFSGEEIKINGETNRKAHITLLSYDPKTEMISKIVPNDYEPTLELDGNFEIPSRLNSGKYAMVAFILENDSRDEVAEFMILLATKTKFEFLSETKASSFYKRLDELGRKNWRKIELGYTIYRK